MIGLVAVVPVRGLRGGKTRLSDRFGEDDRAALTCGMLRHVLAAVRDAGVVHRVAVVTPDPAVAAAFPHPADRIELLRQPAGQSGLNAALRLGRGWAADQGVARMLVLSADLPLLRLEDVQELAGVDAPVVLAPDRHGTGTNALLLRLDESTTQAFAFGFGEHSARRHLAEADRLGLPASLVHVSGTAFDLDTPDDWEALPVGVQERLMPSRVGVAGAVPCP